MVAIKIKPCHLGHGFFVRASLRTWIGYHMKSKRPSNALGWFEHVRIWVYKYISIWVNKDLKLFLDILTYLLMVRHKANYYNQPQRIITLTIMKDSKSTSLLNEQCSFMVVDTLCAFYWLLTKQPTDCEIDWQSFDIAIFNEVVTNTYPYFL